MPRPAREVHAGIPGDKEYEAKVGKLRASLYDSIPANLRLPSSILDDLPVNVLDVASTCGLLSKEELAITELDATDVRDKIASGQLSAVEVVSAIGKRAVIGHQVTGCLTEIFLDEGIARAKELDEHYKKTGTVCGPLHGVPISVKDHMRVKGHRSSGGFLSTLETSEEDCDLVAILRSMGAVFYVKTNQPQGIMHGESQSFYQRTVNPNNINLSAGGSSGGEGALIAFKGSCLGLGSDIGGSIRIPAAQNGIYGMRPTTYQLPLRGMMGLSGWTGVVPATGPMCRSLRDVELFTNLVLSAEPHLHDDTLYKMPWDGKAGSVPSGRKLKIGIMDHDDLVQVQPPMQRAMKLVREKLSALPNVEVVDLKAYKHDLGWDLTQELFFPGGVESFKHYLQGEQLMPLSEYITGGTVKDHSFVELLQLLAKRDEYRQQYNDHYVASGVDAFVCPPYPGSSPPHDKTTYLAWTSTWNILDYPAVVIPTGVKVDPKLDPKPTSFKTLSKEDQLNYDLYDPELQVGAPVTVQIVSRKCADAMVVTVAKLLDDALKA